MRRLAVLLLVAPLAAGCSSSGPKAPKIGAARTFKLAGFRPAAPVVPRRPTTVAFTIDQPSGKPLTQYNRGAGPHTGVHLIAIKDDLSTIIHRHPPLQPRGRFEQRMVFPTAGRYRVIVDAYPRAGVLRNFQLFKDVVVRGNAPLRPLGAYRRSAVEGGFRFQAPQPPRLRAGYPAFLRFRVSDRFGRPAHFVPWYGALAHAIFFRARTLDYFHTHVCAPGVGGCASIVAGSRVAGKSNAPGKLTVGVLLPTPGTWKLFLQARPSGRVVTVPYVLHVT
jgi:hypothetical protein